MRIIFTFFLCAMCIKLSAQDSVKIEVSTGHHDNGQLWWRGMVKREFYKAYTQNSNIGLWEHWYSNGVKESEHMYNPNRFYMNMWLPDGTQILKDGNGCIYEWDRWEQNSIDSCVYDVKDGKCNGKYIRYRIRGGSRYIVQNGEYVNEERAGLFTYRDTVISKHHQTYYVNGELNGLYREFYSSGNLKTEGQYRDNDKESTWKYYNEIGMLLYTANYNKGSLLGPYTEYHSNGMIKLSGQYVHISGKQKTYVEDLATGKMSIKKRFSKTILARDGEWKYYNKNGELKKIKRYKERREKKYPELW